MLVENFKPGTAGKLGIGYEDLKDDHPSLVYASLSAYGQDGPLGHRPAYDHIIQGMVGIMYTTGTPDTVPNKVGSPYVDYATGLMGAFAAVAAVMERDRTGQGQRVDVAMLDTAMLLMASPAVATAASGTAPAPTGNEAFSGAPLLRHLCDDRRHRHAGGQHRTPVQIVVRSHRPRRLAGRRPLRRPGRPAGPCR